MLFQDARDYQILFLSVFLSLGILTRDWTLQLELIPVAIATCLLTQFVLSQFVFFVNTLNQNTEYPDYPLFSLKYRLLEFLSSGAWKSALITALGLCLLLRTNHYQTMILAGSLGISSKFMFCYRGKHFFNPANAGIIGALILTSDAWVSPGQWGNEVGYLLLFLGLGGIVLKRVGRWDTSVVFLLTYMVLEGIRNFYLGGSWEVLHHQLMSGSLLLFALFMLTDPRSIPDAVWARCLWAMGIGILTFILHDTLYVSTAIFWALFLFSPLTLLLDHYFTASPFQWHKTVTHQHFI